MTIWTDFVKEYAAKKKVHYMVASSDPKCREAYKKSKNVVNSTVSSGKTKSVVDKLKKKKDVDEKIKNPKVLKEPKEPKVPKIPKKKLTEKLKGELFSDII